MKEVIGWRIEVEYDDGNVEFIADVPEWVAQPVDEYLSTIGGE